MFGSNGKISNRQSFILFLFDFIGVSTLIVPTYLAREVGAGGVFSILFGGVLGLLYLLLLHELQEKMETDLGTWLRERVTARKRFFVECWLFLHCAAVAGFAAYLFSTLIGQRLLEAEHYSVILLVILVVAGYAVSGGIESRARVYEVLSILIFVPLLLMLAASGTQMDGAYLEGFPEADFVSLLKGGYLVFLFYAVAFWTLFFTGFLAKPDGVTIEDECEGKSQKKQGIRMQRKQKMALQQKQHRAGFFKNVAAAMILTSILLAAVFLICLGNFGRAALAEMDFPVITLMSSIKIPGNFVKRLDTIMIAVWFFTLFAFLDLHIFYGEKMLEGIRGNDGTQRKWSKNRKINVSSAKQPENSNEATIRIGCVLLLSGILGLLFHYNENILAWFETYIWYIGTPLFVLVPILIYWAGRGKT